jgi:hypothetical protein
LPGFSDPRLDPERHHVTVISSHRNRVTSFRFSRPAQNRVIVDAGLKALALDSGPASFATRPPPPTSSTSATSCT